MLVESNKDILKVIEALILNMLVGWLVLQMVDSAAAFPRI